MHTGIYLIYLVRLDGKAVYVGFTSQTLNTRWLQHCNKAKKKCKFAFHNAIRKYGKDSFTIEVIYAGNDLNHTLKIMEPKFIVEYNTHINNDGYNMTIGGEGVVGHEVSLETRQKISSSKLGKTLTSNHRKAISISNKGRKITTEQRKNLSISKKGKLQSDKHKNNRALSMVGQKRSEETKKKMSISQTIRRQGTAPC